ncbi:MAG: signal recognition particle-docking protein FtsY [Candidatus Diapherotrites archaeon]
MFEFLKKTINNFTNKIKETIGKKREETQEQQKEDIIKTETLTHEKTQQTEEKQEETKKNEEQTTSKTKTTDKKEKQEKKQKHETIKEEKRELKAKTNIIEKIKGTIIGKIKITEKDTQDFFDELELSLLEADVEQETANAIVKQLKQQLIGKEIQANQDITKFLKEEIKKAITKIMETKTINIMEMKQKPLKILFLGPNGAGKTTSIAKIAHMLKEKGKTSIIAASDTFRAASIEQLEEHAKKIGIKVIKQNYGSDPTAVAYDAVKAAEAKQIDIVLIDTAGRQETNKNLIEELKKIERVIKPDLKIYVAEAYTGQALINQIREFDKAINIDAIILTKIDTDTKGGTAISLLYNLKKPIIYVGTGQKYQDLEEFKPEFIIDKII